MKNIIFDFDGTIVDTSEGIVKSIHYAFERLNIHKITDQEIRAIIGPPLRDMLELLLKTQDEELIASGIRFFRERYGNEGLRELELYKGVRETLQILYKNNFNLFIVTSKPYIFVLHILQELGIRHYFKDISGVKMNGKDLDKITRLGQIISKYDLLNKQTIMIGDSCEDIIAAKLNHIRSLGVEYGYGKKEDLLKQGAYKTVKCFQDIVTILDDKVI